MTNTPMSWSWQQYSQSIARWTRDYIERVLHKVTPAIRKAYWKAHAKAGLNDKSGGLRGRHNKRQWAKFFASRAYQAAKDAVGHSVPTQIANAVNALINVNNSGAQNEQPKQQQQQVQSGIRTSHSRANCEVASSNRRARRVTSHESTPTDVIIIKRASRLCIENFEGVGPWSDCSAYDSQGRDNIEWHRIDVENNSRELEEFQYWQRRIENDIEQRRCRIEQRRCRIEQREAEIEFINTIIERDDFEENLALAEYLRATDKRRLGGDSSNTTERQRALEGRPSTLSTDDAYITVDV